MNTLARRLFEARTSRNLTQEELGKHAGLHGLAISHYECGRRVPSIENLVAMANVLDVSLDWLTGRQEKQLPDLMPGPQSSRLVNLASKLTGHDLETLLGLAENMARRFMPKQRPDKTPDVCLCGGRGCVCCSTHGEAA